MKIIRQKCFNCAYIKYIKENGVPKAICYLKDAPTFDENLCDDYTNDNKIREIVTAGKGWG